MNTAADIALVGVLAGIWLTAGLLADALPDATTARALHRRSRTLSLLIAAGAVVLVSVPVIAGMLAGDSAAPEAASLSAVPTMIVLTVSLRRLTALRRGAAAFASAPRTPAPPALRAAAAHPLVATPLQVAGLAAIVGVPIAAGLVTVPGASVAGMLITFVGLMVIAIGVRHALRHSRLAELGMPSLTRRP